MEVCKGHVHKGIKVLMSRTYYLQVGGEGCKKKNMAVLARVKDMAFASLSELSLFVV
jgi:hypothetical protein